MTDERLEPCADCGKDICVGPCEAASDRDDDRGDICPVCKSGSCLGACTRSERGEPERSGCTIGNCTCGQDHVLLEAMGAKISKTPVPEPRTSPDRLSVEDIPF